MNNAHSVLKKAVVTALFLLCTIAACLSQSISPDEYVRAVAVNANGAVRAEVNLDGSLTVTETLAKSQTRLDGLKPTRAFALAFSPNGRFLAAADTQGRIQVWDVSTRNLVHTIFQPGGVWSLAFDSQGKRLAAGGHKMVCVWDPNSGDELRKWPIRDTSMSLSFDTNGKWLAAADFSVLHVWSLDGEESLEAKVKDFEIGTVAFSPDGKVVATGGGLGVSNNGTVQLWRIGDVLTGTAMGVLPNRVGALAFSPDGVSIAAGSPTGVVKLWSTSNGSELETLTTDDYIAALTFSGGGSTLVAVTGPNLDEKSALLSWELHTGKN
jgi:WD40 repeat protein